MAETRLVQLAAGLPPDIREKFQVMFGKLTPTFTEINRLAEVTPGTAKASAAAILGAYKNLDCLYFGAVQSAALLHGGGTAASPLATAVADKNFKGYWTKSTASTGDSRNTYLRHYLSATGGGVPMGDCLRAFTTVDGTGYNSAQGVHATVGLAEDAAISGLAVGVRATLGITAAKAPGGTLAAIQADSDVGAGATLPPNASFIRVADNGAVHLAVVLEGANLDSGAKSDVKAVATGCGALTDDIRLRCIINGTVCWLGATTAAPSTS